MGFFVLFFTKGNVLTLCTRTLHAVSHPNRAKLIVFSILIHTPWRICPQKLVTLVYRQHCSFDEFIFGWQVLSKRTLAGWCVWLEHWWKDYMPMPSPSFSQICVLFLLGQYGSSDPKSSSPCIHADRSWDESTTTTGFLSGPQWSSLTWLNMQLTLKTQITPNRVQVWAFQKSRASKSKFFLISGEFIDSPETYIIGKKKKNVKVNFTWYRTFKPSYVNFQTIWTYLLLCCQQLYKKKAPEIK